jgi:hypothetical protein
MAARAQVKFSSSGAVLGAVETAATTRHNAAATWRTGWGPQGVWGSSQLLFRLISK